MKLKDSYDVICSGGGLSSYLCAALLARSGKRVLVVDEYERAMPRRSDDGYFFDPDFVTFGGLDESSALGTTLRELGLLDEKDFSALDSIVQVLTPRYRAVFWNDFDKTIHELQREVENVEGHAKDFLHLLYRAGKEIPDFAKWVLTPSRSNARSVSSWKKFWGRYYSGVSRHSPLPLWAVLPHQARQICSDLSTAALGALSYSAPNNLGGEQALRGLCLLFSGQYYYVGGLERLKSRLAEVITSCGGAVKKSARVESLISEGGQITGVLLSSYEGIIQTGIVVLGNRLKHLYSTLPSEMQDPSLLRTLARIEPQSWRFTVAVTLKKEVIPIGLTPNMVYVGSFQHPLEEENFLRIQRSPDGQGASDDSVDTDTIFVTAFVPYRASSLDYSYLRQLGGKMLRKLSEILPFMEDNIVALHPDFRGGDEELKEYYPFSGLDWVPQNLIQYYVRGQKSAQDFWGPSWTTPHHNLYFSGRSIWPSLGIYGEALAAHNIYRDVLLPVLK